MNITTDAHYMIGGLHVRQMMPCQDHTRCGSQYVSLSDGCSTGGETDTGARVLNAAASIALEELLAQGTVEAVPVALKERIVGIAAQVFDTMRLKENDLHATLFYALVTPQGGFAHAFGDGVVALRYIDGTTIVYKFEWTLSTPYYPSYGEGAMRNFIYAHRNDNGRSLTVTKTVSFKGILSEETIEYLSALEGSNGYGISLSATDVESLELVALFSDGIFTFEEGKDSLALETVLSDALAFKQWKGEFVKRRFNRMLGSYAAEGITHYDDVSFAAIHVTP